MYELWRTAVRKSRWMGEGEEQFLRVQEFLAPAISSEREVMNDFTMVQIVILLYAALQKLYTRLVDPLAGDHAALTGAVSHPIKQGPT